MKIVRKIPVELPLKEYGGWDYLWENETHIFVTQTDREGYVHTEVHALSKKIWRSIKE